ncbi:chemotaxis protein MotB [Acetitomaculum ruminis DSM 5522]|uniref:Chemotaxis protein MotB n=1 Tax=Acetitomaculum ruminis DSM 5522 TaxID=1120918 RepID=A0A1I0ZKU3_9FIRM|nr:flagellar motor protein MotB [Acetitomaculum ruminis]SFB25140.1 chemotaxis protein MotB [Acetitomaculum ruminis DSM 5522]
MAKQKQEDPPKGSPAWMATFSDLMNLLLCFFVLLFSMSSVDSAKYEQLVASLQSAFSVLPSGGSTIVEEGTFVSSGVSQLEEFDSIYNSIENEGMGTDNNVTEEDPKNDKTVTEENISEEKLKEEYLYKAEEESEKMEKIVEDQAKQSGILDDISLSHTSAYTMLSLNGALLFDSGSADIKAEAITVVDKVGDIIIAAFPENKIEIEGHTDNVPISSSAYRDNKVLSTFRALSVTEYLVNTKGLNVLNIKYSGRGEYDPIDTNDTPEGRAKNRRVEIKIYNSYSDF